jgi:hypothetical protein
MHVFLWHVLFRRSLSALFVYTLFAFAMALLALLAFPEFAAFAAFSFVRLIMHWHVRAFAYSATLFAFFCVPGTAPYPWGELCGRMMADTMGPDLCACIGLCLCQATQPYYLAPDIWHWFHSGTSAAPEQCLMAGL